MRHALGIALVVLAAGSARADRREIVNADPAHVREAEHRVEVEIADGTARFVVTRRFASRDAHVAELRVAIDLPGAAIARELWLPLASGWQRAELDDAAEADRRWDALVTTGAQMARGPAILRWRELARLDLTVYPLAPGDTRAVRYQLEAPACYAQGRWITAYPTASDDGAPITLVPRGARVITADALARELGAEVSAACADDVPIDPTRALIVAAASPIAPVDLARPTLDGGARVAAWRASAAGTRATTVHVEVAPVIAPVPRDLRVVFVVDASRSLGPDGIAAQLAWIDGYLADAPGARAELVLVRRFAERGFGRWRRGADARRALIALTASQRADGNGSFLDRGLAMAAAVLRDGRGPARVIAFTDQRWRDTLDADGVGQALAALPTGTIAHVVSLGVPLEGTPPTLAREPSDADVAQAAARTGGMAVWVSGSAAQPAAAFATAARPLVQPIAIDELTLVGVDDASQPSRTADGRGAVDAPRTLTAGTGWTRSWLDGRDAPVELRGWIWGRPWRRVIAPTRDQPAYAARVLADELALQLDAAATAALAHRGHAVSPATSLLAVDPRAPAARRPDDWLEGGTGYSSSCGPPYAPGGIGHGTGTGHPLAPIDPAPLTARLAPQVRGCLAPTGAGSSATVDLTVTDREIVDVAVDVRTSDTVHLARARACVEDAAWDLELDAASARPRGRVTLTFR